MSAAGLGSGKLFIVGADCICFEIVVSPAAPFAFGLRRFGPLARFLVMCVSCPPGPVSGLLSEDCGDKGVPERGVGEALG